MACTWAMSARQLAAADLQLEDVVAPRLDQRERLVDVARRIAAGERPQHRQRVAHRAAEQRVDRQAEALALRVEQRDLDGRLGEGVALHRRGQRASSRR